MNDFLKFNIYLKLISVNEGLDISQISRII